MHTTKNKIVKKESDKAPECKQEEEDEQSRQWECEINRQLSCLCATACLIRPLRDGEWMEAVQGKKSACSWEENL